ncbi:MAG: aldose 1-epimerase family protein [Planctomycetota bacterium]|nr:aldose 1-epimerase family protein [Planctomycetota bacterium]
MAKKTWTLTDVAQDVYREELAISPADIEAPGKFSIAKRRLHGGLRDGVDVIEVDNGRMRFVVVPTRGMGLWRAFCGDVHLGWSSPKTGPVHPAFVNLWEPSGLGWLDGFDELLVRCGLESNGSPERDPSGALHYPLHGKIANTPAQKVEVSVDGDSGEISVAGVVEETRLFFNKLQLTSTYTTKIGQPGFTVTDTVTNLWAEPSELELLYHINFGMPLLGPGAKAVLPVGKLAPRDQTAVADLAEWNVYGPEAPGKPEVVFFVDLAAGDDGRTTTLLKNAESTRGVSLEFDKRQFPCFSLWKNCQAASDGYVTGFEPAINFPNGRSFEKSKGRVATLRPGESRSFEIRLTAHGTPESVADAEKAVAALQAGREPEILGTPDPEWSAP